MTTSPQSHPKLWRVHDITRSLEKGLVAACLIACAGQGMANNVGENSAWQFQTSADKANQAAIQDMVQRRKAGSYVCHPRVHSAVLEIHDIRSEVEALGLVYGYALKSRSSRKANAQERQWLDMGAKGEILHLAAVHSGGKIPFCHEERLINLGAVPEASDQAFETLAPGHWLLGQVPWSAAEHSIRAAAAKPEAALRLNIEPGTPCLVITRRTFSGGAVITRVELTYPGDRHELIARFSPG